MEPWRFFESLVKLMTKLFSKILLKNHPLKSLSKFSFSEKRIKSNHLSKTSVTCEEPASAVVHARKLGLGLDDVGICVFEEKWMFFSFFVFFLATRDLDWDFVGRLGDPFLTLFFETIFDHLDLGGNFWPYFSKRCFINLTTLYKIV